MNIFSYRGRIGRQKYIIGLIVAAVLSVIIEFVYFFVVLASITLALSRIGFLAVIVVFLLGIVIAFVPVFLTSAVIVKRFHDVGRSGKWWFALLVPIYNIHLAIGLLTERGTTGPNQYGEDILPPNTPDDIFSSFGQNKVARVIADVLIIGLCLLFFMLNMMLDVKSKVQQQTAQQSFLNQTINTDTMQPFPDEKSDIVPQSTINNLFTALKPPVDVNDTSAWKSVLVKVDFSTLNLGKSVVCYTMKYPANLFYAETVNYRTINEWFMTTHYNGVSSMNALYVEADGGDGVVASNQLSVDVAEDESAMASVYKQGYGLKSFDTISGLQGEELTGGKGLWSIYVPISEKSGDLVLKIQPSLMYNNVIDNAENGNTFYDSTLGEAMAKTIQASSCTQ
jgi:uncharacterized membrane protein YhaH (DUF805 family)